MEEKVEGWVEGGGHKTVEKSEAKMRTGRRVIMPHSDQPLRLLRLTLTI
jgi:hypothetical protein